MYFVVSIVQILLSKNKMHWCHASQLLFGLVTQCPLFLVGERVCCMTKPNSGFNRTYIYNCSSNRENIIIISLQLVPSNISLHVPIILPLKANWNSVISVSEDTLNKGIGLYFWEGSLIGCCLSGLFPLSVKRDKMQFVYKNQHTMWLSPRHLKVNFICRKSQNMGELHEKATISSI